MTGVARRLFALGLLALAACGAEPPTAAAPPIPLSPPTAPLPPELVRDLREGTPEQRRKAVQTLGAFGSRAAEELPQLLLALEDPADAVLRRNAAATITRIGTAARGAAKALARRITDDPDAGVRETAAKALIPICADIDEVRPALVTSFRREEDEGVRRYVILTLKRHEELALQAPPRGAARIGEQLRRGDGFPLASLASWPCYRGPDLDGVSRENVRLAERWPDAGPKVLWSVPLGEGYSGAAVHAGRVYVLDYDRADSGEGIRCLSLADGREIWRRWTTVKLLNNHGVTRSTPAVNDDVVVAVGVQGHVLCCDMATGELRWTMSLQDDYGAKLPSWYGAQSPLLDGPMAIFAVGGRDVLMAAIHCDCGSPAWTTPNPGGWTLSHSSVTPAVIGGRLAYLYASPQGVAAVSGEPGKGGRLLWSTSEWTTQVQAPSPVPLSDGTIFLTAGYDRGSAMLRAADGAASIAWSQGVREGGSSELQTPIFHEGSMYLVMPKTGGPLKEQLVCLDPFSGAIRWSSGKERRFGSLEPYVLGDGKLFVLDGSGVLTMLRARCDRYEELGRAKVLSGPDCWGPPALADGRLLVRDLNRLVCLDLRP